MLLSGPGLSSFDGKVYIVTGASDGIGAHLAAGLRARGARLVLSGRDEARLAAGATQNDLAVAGDLTIEATRVAIVERTIERYGRIDGLINNAGRGSYFKPSEAPIDDARSLFELNFFAPLHLAQLATPWIVKSRGSLVNIGSIAGQISLPWLPVYSASKFALASLTATQRMELRRHGVHVMSVYPGYVDTGFQAHAAGSSPPDEIVKGRRFAVTAEECARAVIRGMERRSKVVVTPRIGWVLIMLNRLFPQAVESRLGGVRAG
jgi:short-subunit dehydrogenase